MLAAIAACFAAAAAADVQPGSGAWSSEQTWASDAQHGGRLTGYYYWPKSQPVTNGKRALILVLHGCAQTARNDVINGPDGGFNWAATAEKYGALILAPNATGNVAGVHCWDYYGMNHSRTAGHPGVLLELVTRYLKSPQHAIDPDQVYVVGLSSGGGMTNVLACLAPDVFAGAGSNAGPGAGTSKSEATGISKGYTETKAAGNCNTLAGSRKSHLNAQIYNAIYGTADNFVPRDYSRINVDAMKIVYGGSFTSSAFDLAGGGSGTNYEDAAGLRASLIAVGGMAHAWPAGPGGQGVNYVDNTHVNYPEYITGFFFANNRRNSAPIISSCDTGVSGASVTITAAARDPNGRIASYAVFLSGGTPVTDSNAGSGDRLSKTYGSLAQAWYAGYVTATDNQGNVSSQCQLPEFRIGNPSVPAAPANLRVTGHTSNAISMAWDPSNVSTSYNVYRNGAKLGAVTAPAVAYRDSGLAANTSYAYFVKAENGSGESTASNTIQQQTDSACMSETSSNYAHVQNGRAYNSAGYAHARGSNQRMGLNNTFYTTTLSLTQENYWIIGNCPQ